MGGDGGEAGMNKKQIEKLEAGRDADTLIAEEVFHAKVWGRSVNDGPETLIMTRCSPHRELPHYSTDIAAAFEIVEHFKEKSVMLSLSWGKDGGWWCVIYPFQGSPAEGHYAETAPLAIVKAALLATLEAK